MSSEWRTAKLVDVAAKKRWALNGGPFGSKLSRKHYSESGVPVIRGTNLSADTKFSFDDFVYVSEEKADELRANNAHPGDLIFTQRGTIGQVGLIPFESPIPRFVISQSQMKLTVDPEQADALFLYYFFTAADTVQKIQNLAFAAGVPHINLDILRKFETPVPPLGVQRRIAGILSAYDELMENSQRRIRLLEAMARALYRECIREDGDSTSVKGILETDYWTFISANVSPYGGTKRYYATADIEGLAVQGAGIDYTFAEKPSRAQKQPTPFSLWFARMKDTYKIAWYSEVNAQSADSTILSSGFAGFQAVEPLYFPLLFLTVSSKEFHAQKDLYCTGATQMSLTNEGLSIIEVPAPTKRAARRLGERTLPLLNQILVLQLRIQNLRRTRDLLLPRLLSGQVSLAVNGT